MTSTVIEKVGRGLYGDELNLDLYREKVVVSIGLSRGKSFGGLTIVKDNERPEIGWVDIYAPGCLPSLNEFRAILMIAMTTDLEYLAVNIHRAISTQPRLIRKICEQLGLEKVSHNTYTVKLSNEVH